MNAEKTDEPHRNNEARDLATGLRGYGVIWGIPIAALVATGVLTNSSIVMLVVWPLALAWMGAACLYNARRCGRLHCFITGPYFLVLAVLSLLHGSSTLSLGPDGWNWIGWATAIGGIGLTYVPEWIWGRYARR